MKTAHQGLAASALPGLGGAGWMSALPQPQGAVAAGTPAAAGSRPQSDRGLDFWLLDRLFGRR